MLAATAGAAAAVVANLVLKNKKKLFGKSDDVPGGAETLSLIKNRRSVFPKDYTGEQVPEEVIKQLLEAGNWAPTHGKTEPWRFVVFSSQEAISNLYELFNQHAKATMSAESYAEFADRQQKKSKDRKNVSHLIAIMMKRQAKEEKLMPEWEEIAATACAVENMYLQATAIARDQTTSGG